ncbi:MAG: MFS transporter [Clostridiales bacterium]|nr:MFS transporter [Clostridiales bacterium]
MSNEKKGKIQWTPRLVLTIVGLSLAGSVIYELPYLKYAYYDSLLAAFDLTNAQSGMLLSVYATSCMLLYIPGGLVADRWSAKKCMLFSLFGTGILGLILCFSMNRATAYIVWFLFGLSTSFVMWVALMKAIRLTGTKDTQGTIYGLYYALSGVIAVLTSFLFWGLYSKYISVDAPSIEDHKKAMFAVIMAMSIVHFVAGILVAITYKDHEDLDADEEKFRFRDVPKALSNPNIWIASALMFCMYAVYSCSSYFTPYFTSALGVDASESALLSILRTYVFFFFCPVLGKFADKVMKSTLRTYVIGFVLLGLLYTGVLLVPASPESRNVCIAISFCAGLFSVMMYGIMWSILTEIRIPTLYAATAVGICSIFVYMPDLFLHTVFGNWLDVHGNDGYFRIFLTLGLLCVVAIVLCFTLRHRVLSGKGIEESSPAESDI